MKGGKELENLCIPYVKYLLCMLRFDYWRFLEYSLRFSSDIHADRADQMIRDSQAKPMYIGLAR